VPAAFINVRTPNSLKRSRFANGDAGCARAGAGTSTVAPAASGVNDKYFISSLLCIDDFLTAHYF
jgi:hypothetical protein